MVFYFIFLRLRFHKVLWGNHGMADSSMPSGVIVAGTDNGQLKGWDSAKLLTGKLDEGEVFSLDKHTGSVKALDFNPFQVWERFKIESVEKSSFCGTCFFPGFCEK